MKAAFPGEEVEIRCANGVVPATVSAGSGTEAMLEDLPHEGQKRAPSGTGAEQCGQWDIMGQDTAFPAGIQRIGGRRAGASRAGGRSPSAAPVPLTPAGASPRPGR